MSNQPRYAIYYAPASSDPLWRFGSAVLGYDAETGADVPRHLPELSGKSWHDVTVDPRRYGFHATLKAPFHLQEGKVEAELIAAVEDFAANAPAIALPRLSVKALGPFIALTLATPNEAIQAFAASITRHFEPFRAPLSPADRARRLKSPLTEVQINYLDRYGYPYVFDEFRFHMTLTGPMHPDDRTEALRILADAYAQQAATPLPALHNLTIFKQASAAERFRIIARAP